MNSAVRSAISPSPACADLTSRPRAALFAATNWRRPFLGIACAIVLGIGIFLRIYPSAGFHDLGADELGYMVFFKQIDRAGPWNYDTVVHVYVERQYERSHAVVPATRVGFLAPAYLIGKGFHLSPFQAIRATACVGSILALLLGALFAGRAGGRRQALAVTALFAVAPLQIALAQRALIDSYFAFWALAAFWVLWENLRRPNHRGWLSAHVFSLVALVLTKENSAFVVFALTGILLSNRFLRFGTVTPRLWLATVAGPLVAIVLLAALIGGFGDLIRFYAMFVEKSRDNLYSIVAQDGPWYRYAVDFFLISPVLLFLAFGRLCQLRLPDNDSRLMALFLGLSLLVMASVRYATSVRYAAYFEFPLCWLASSQIFLFFQGRPGKLRKLLLASTLVVVAGISLFQYRRVFVIGQVYDPTTAALVWSQGMEKSPRFERLKLERAGKKPQTVQDAQLKELAKP